MDNLTNKIIFIKSLSALFRVTNNGATYLSIKQLQLDKFLSVFTKNEEFLFLHFKDEFEIEKPSRIKKTTINIKNITIIDDLTDVYIVKGIGFKLEKLCYDYNSSDFKNEESTEIHIENFENI